MGVPIGPQGFQRAKLYDSHAGFIAYVPAGSIRRGLKLVETGGATTVGGKMVEGKTTKCTQCHGTTLHGMPAMPDGAPLTSPLAGAIPIGTAARRGAFLTSVVFLLPRRM